MRLNGAQRYPFGRDIEIEEIDAHEGLFASQPAITLFSVGSGQRHGLTTWRQLIVAETILSGARTGSPRLILSTFSIPEVTFPQTEYCLSRKRASPKQMKN